ncbi:acetyl-CoA synthetase (ADP-forming) [Desulfatibacillum alkenivorans DSM 16219]|jgi:acetyl-CoA synthetase (ADP-forming)|uniref:Acetyl-CoA synthetase (ADP-forming) n=1 Tax=Desulfatibacillum alkenivorans DSM 16219 TaxID=1121393 RepID=A0A1M6JB81_9BACT|nr:acetate--CoA ligase family protein [Desulfatibacillum alkenivorans]SHJ43968.1 acetyl-CoA synthetase (ADP-forming) [Desulfatibacillum alkenivorans DSM 16219]
MEIIEKALADGRSTLSESESKQVLNQYNIPITKEILATNAQELDQAVQEIGFPLVMKGCAADLAHKTESGLVKIDIRDAQEAREAFESMMSKMDSADKGVLVQEMVKGKRELVVGLTRDPQFGPCVMFGLGGIFTEVLEDIAFRVAPITKADALDMMAEIKGKKILEAIRGMEAADKDMLADILVAVGKLGEENQAVSEVDINPLILTGGKPVAVDALVVLAN